MCGEQFPYGPLISRSNGSSPRVRGTAHDLGLGVENDRFIPACAGNSPLTGFRRLLRPVHPRVCGEQSRFLNSCIASDGSSPRVRGTALETESNDNSKRFIPACAGNRLRLIFRTIAPPVHPRVCGEQGIRTSLENAGPGSSPRVRGTGGHQLQAASHVRFIPACAGNRGDSRISLRSLAVHPRVCGEQRLISSDVGAVAGSSPRVRGTGYRRFARRYRHRFIPACAGNSCMRSRAPVCLSVHPRVCGEQDPLGGPVGWLVGSSPRVRGTD